MTPLLLLLATGLAAPTAPRVDTWAEVAATAELPEPEVRAMLSGLEPNQAVLDAMAVPWERKPWHAYARIFLTPARIAGGRAFLATHADTLRRAEEEYGVPAAMITAILGIETTYGANQGDHAVLEALFTLGFHHPRRGRFFRSELGHFLRLGTDEGWALSERTGSYAGAMGMAQFMPSSYRRWSVDFDGDEHRDLFGSIPDAIGSIANYFRVHGWAGTAPALVPAEVDPARVDTVFAPKGLKLEHTVDELRAAGVTLPAELDGAARARLFRYEQSDGVEYLVGLHDFYVITRYNHSAAYARAAVELAAAVSAPEE